MAYLLDTNVVSELHKGNRADAAVRAWYETARPTKPYLSVIVLAELRYGIERLRANDPARMLPLERWIREITREYSEEILPVTPEIADVWGRLSPGQPLPPFDGLLAATALVHDLTLVTRNTRDFDRSGARLFNPFQES